MKYIIMCGGHTPERHLVELNGEPLVARTIRLLRQSGVNDIYISTNSDRFSHFGVPTIQPEVIEKKEWIDGAFPVLDEPTCYVFGDVMFSPAAIQIIVETETDDVEFFASAPPFGALYRKSWAEPFGFKVVNYEHFAESIEKAQELYRTGKLKRLVSWELWQVIKGTQLHVIDYTSYTRINDYTCDIDDEKDAEDAQSLIARYRSIRRRH